MEVGMYCHLSKDDGTDNEVQSIATEIHPHGFM